MGRYIRWQAIIVFLGIALTLAFLGFLSFSRTTVSVPDDAGRYIEGVAGQPQFINPLLAQYNQVDQDLTALIFNGLTRHDGRGGLEADLAAEWEVSEDGLSYLFRLREDVQWQDGEPFTAEDVVFTIGLMQDPTFPGVPYLHDMWQNVTVQQEDEYTVRFVLNLEEPFPPFLDFTTIGILPEHLLADVPAAELLNTPFNLEPIGTGPYQLEEVNTQFVRLNVNRDYFGLIPRLATLEFRFYESHQQVIAAYRGGEVQGISYVPPSAIPDVSALESLDMYTARLSGYDLVYFNLQAAETLPFFQEAAVRQALALALDKQAIIDDALNGQGVVAHSPIREWVWAYNPEQPIPTYDVAQATTLLDGAGWVDSDGNGIREREGVPLAFTLLVGASPEKLAVAESLAAQWQQIGVDVTIEQVGASLVTRLAAREFEAALAEIAIVGDPDPYPLWHSTQIEGGQNYGGWNNEQVSQLLATGRSTLERGPRNDSYFEFQRIFAEEVPAIVLYYPVYNYGISREVFDVQLAPLSTPSDRFRTLPTWYVMTQEVIFRDTQFEETEP